MDQNITLRKIEQKDCSPDLLAKFDRYREVKRCWRKENGAWILKDIAFTEQWDDTIKAQKIEGFIARIKNGGIVFGAYLDHALIAYFCIDRPLFGCRNEYINLDSLQVSYGFRHRGIGRILFEKACAEAKMLGAKKLYISAHSAEETQAFYKAVGCYETVELNQALFDEEPYDCHMECLL